MNGWLVNDQLSPFPQSKMLWHDLLEWMPDLEDMTGGYTDYSALPDLVDREYHRRFTAGEPLPRYIIRNATYFRWLNIDVPTISLLQDIQFGQLRAAQLDVCRNSALTVFNSEFTRMQYPELEDVPQMIIPLGTDFDLFQPAPAETRALWRDLLRIYDKTVLFIGSGHEVKGFSEMYRLFCNTGWEYCFVFKDDAHVQDPRAREFRRVPHDHLMKIINACRIGVCTSVRETQHLAGIEMGACGLPLVTTSVGAYHDREAGVWGTTAEAWEFKDRIAQLMEQPDTDETRMKVRQYWIQAGYDRTPCELRWRAAIAHVLGEPE